MAMTNLEKKASMVRYIPVINVQNGREYEYMYSYSLAYCGKDEQIVQAQVLCRDEYRIETVNINDLAIAPGIDLNKARFTRKDRRGFDYSPTPKPYLTDNQILEAMRKHVPVICDGIKYIYIDKFIISYNDKGQIIKELKLLDACLSSFNTVPAYKVQLLPAVDTSNNTTANMTKEAACSDPSSSSSNTAFGYCTCGGILEPVYFTENEYTNANVPTGRKRTNIDYLLCPHCGKKFATDGETFASPWYR